MTAQLLDGTALAEQVRLGVKEEVAAWVTSGRPAPCLATVLVGENPASQSYVKGKRKASAEVGIDSLGYELPATATQAEVEDLVRQLNADPRVNGILVQLPLPSGLDEERVLSAISIEKDVDGFHPLNIGRLAQKGRDPLFIPCTPAGVMYMLNQVMPSLEGVNAVVLGRSNIVGMPVALLLVRANATVTICHSRTKNLPDVVRSADVLVAAVGRAEMVRGDWVKPGAVVIDVGINRVEDATRPRGYRLVGDVAFDEAKEVAGIITPVPGGVGPMTIAMLLSNTLAAAKLAHQ
ncbi:MAG TPA: bifunctional methylenetetrahydrofolate dehydrogenase/methenyltetrahydrofolate cyclohydrolase FolD [Anaerolineaceae bacterium]|nr:bifunctional methylenetetrahydrofolate dehydrogenase/methenyltetrahydrofolate cyclohydrolase FolD [Anaerolineaceae bacterium]HNS36641.1 bifunctional methylenetetrahydrofolate dehydrogenase/methenyltetrahydrofolate cyclohydrolase FolD [Anaerolineaceae bacterium]HOG79475.1 bifunctional methylenetetrahydrofolate dehydrogenase/methenyltetrahydrofolate cyclohydrolase FolD [Anaerolineaceae bacterium]